jgi:hypothetical protein
MHPLAGRKQTREHIERRMAKIRAKYPRVVLKCEICQCEFSVSNDRKNARFCSRVCFGKHRSTLRGEKAYSFKRGFFIDKDGYRMIRDSITDNARKNKYIMEHKAVMIKKIGRSIKRGEVIHHWDENRLNNDPENLALFRTQASHLRLHLFANRHNIPIDQLKFSQNWLTV